MRKETYWMLGKKRKFTFAEQNKAERSSSVSQHCILKQGQSIHCGSAFKFKCFAFLFVSKMCGRSRTTRIAKARSVHKPPTNNEHKYKACIGGDERLIWFRRKVFTVEKDKRRLTTHAQQKNQRRRGVKALRCSTDLLTIIPLFSLFHNCAYVTWYTRHLAHACKSVIYIRAVINRFGVLYGAGVFLMRCTHTYFNKHKRESQQEWKCMSCTEAQLSTPYIPRFPSWCLSFFYNYTTQTLWSVH